MNPDSVNNTNNRTKSSSPRRNTTTQNVIRTFADAITHFKRNDRVKIFDMQVKPTFFGTFL